MLEHFSEGDYRFLASPGNPFSGGVVADPGFDLVHATLDRPLPLDSGLIAAGAHVEAAGRPVTALAAFELRISEPLTPEGFGEFNRGYVERLKAMGLRAGDSLPAARTNVAPLPPGVGQPCLYAFTYTVPGGRGRPAFLLSGSPETEGTSAGAKLESIAAVLTQRLELLGAGWDDVTGANFYGVTVPEELGGVLSGLGSVAIRGCRWYPSRPPITDLDYEIDARGTGTELTI